jgi:hypothetical protein
MPPPQNNRYNASEALEKPIKHDYSFKTWFSKLSANYDHSVLIMMCLAYFFQGFKTFLNL